MTAARTNRRAPEAAPHAPARRPTMSERGVARLWRDLSPQLPALQCDDGSRFRVLYPGRPSAGAGPDFRDAVLVSGDGVELRGDVELQLRPGGWSAHGHGSDRRRGPRLRRAGPDRGPPALAREEGPPSHGCTGRADHPASPDGPRDADAVRRAGDARFARRSRAIARLHSAVAGPLTLEDGLYEGLMEALGYSRNRRPFMALAQGLPMRALRRMLLGVAPSDRGRALEGLLLGAAGFLDGPREPTPAAPADDPLERWRDAGIRPWSPGRTGTSPGSGRTTTHDIGCLARPCSSTGPGTRGFSTA